MIKLAQLVIPHPDNDHKARLLQIPGLLSLTLLFVFFQQIINFTPKIGAGVLGYASQIPPSAVVELSNQQRLEVGLARLKVNPLLTQAAVAKANDMLEKDYWAHVAPDGTEPWAFFKQVGYAYRYAGENLARDFSSPGDAVAAWMASPSHRDNLLSDRYSEIGVAVVEGELNGVDTTIIVQLFGAQSESAAVPVVAAQPTDTEPTQTSEKPIEIEAQPQPVPVSAKDSIDVSAQTLAPSSHASQISPFQITKYFSLGLVALLLVVLIIDSAIVAHRGVTRIQGRTLAHISFIAMILAIALIAKAGQIY